MPLSRSTWACELKLLLNYMKKLLHLVTLHVSVWVEIGAGLFAKFRHAVTLHVSVWVEMHSSCRLCHSERVTLHVSVWVEIMPPVFVPLERPVTLHVSVWVEMQTSCDSSHAINVTLHVSVWVEMSFVTSLSPLDLVTLHVSVWVEMKMGVGCPEYVLVTLHVSVWVEIQKLGLFDCELASRSTWACELKLTTGTWPLRLWGRHAPRERVSWNYSWLENSIFHTVTLHVSVWIEISAMDCGLFTPLVTLHVSVWIEINAEVSNTAVAPSRSTWACELKSLEVVPVMSRSGHAPRERVSWNYLLGCSWFVG